MPFDIITIGSATIDYFADSDSELIRIDTRTTREELIAFPLGSKILITELNTTTGGGGTNTATSFARLGFNTAYLGKLGNDPAADFIEDKLKEEGIHFIGKRQGKSGISFVLNSIRDDRTILAYKGANDELSPSDLPDDLDSPWLYVSSVLNQSWDTVVGLVCRCDCKVAFNPSSYQAAMGYQALKAMVDRVSILIMNREEACKFLGVEDTRDLDLVALVQSLAKTPEQICAITDGANGVWVYDQQAVYEGHSLPDIKVMESTGAGDAFASTFTACIMRGLPTDQALDGGMTNAESVLRNKGAKEKLLDWDSLQAELSGHQRNIIKHPIR